MQLAKATIAWFAAGLLAPALAPGNPAGAQVVDGSTPAPARFASEFTRRHQRPPRSIDVHHLRLELQLDLEAQRVAGEAALTLSPLAAPLDHLRLHAVDLDVAAVRVDGIGAVPFTLAPGALNVTLPRTASPADTLTVRVEYAATPRLGLYFVPADEESDRPQQVWSQGEAELNRYWYPAWDLPDDRATSELVVTLPAGLTAISNGTLRERRENPDGTVTFDWLDELPHVNYLVSLVAGRFAHLSDQYRDISLDYYVPPAMQDLAARSFGHTADMMRVYEETFGVPYPERKYAQTAVNDFRWGGMENLSATTLTVFTLHDEAAHLTYRSEGLVAHELAHQWFGDLVTCKSWRDIWLNEGFATFAELVYFTASWGEEGMADRLLGFREDYFDEVTSAYRRAIVTDIYAEEDDLFDSHAYDKGALVLVMLRELLGEQVFRHGIQHYLERYAGQTVETAQFRLALEEVSGRDLGRFFDQWLVHGGHPELQVSWSWQEEAGQVEVDVRQVQALDDLTPLFTTPLDLRVTTAAGAQEQRVTLDGEHAVFRVPAAERPLLVQADPRGWLLAAIHLEQDAAYWLRQLAEAPEIMGRVAAARALADFIGEPRVLPGLGRALRADPSRHVRRAAAASLGAIGTDGALAELAAGTGDPEARVRRKVAAALGKFRAPRAVDLLEGMIKDDPSPYVVADALEALGATRADGALDRLRGARRRSSHAHVIEASAYTGMAALEDAAAIPDLLAGTRPRVPRQARAAAIEALGDLAHSLPDERPRLRERLLELVGDPYFAARRAAVSALGASGDLEALPVLRDLARHALEPGLRSRARDGVRKLLREQEQGVAELGRRVDEVERSNRQLREDLEALRGDRR